jgi:hypothetical protein
MTNSADAASDQPIIRTVLMSVPAAGLHMHNCPVVGNIVEGSVTYQIDGQSPSVLRAGDGQVPELTLLDQ